MIGIYIANRVQMANFYFLVNNERDTLMEFKLSEKPVRVAAVRKPAGIEIKDRLTFLAWLDEYMLRLLQLQGIQNQVAWSDYQFGHYMINLAVDVEIEKKFEVSEETLLLEAMEGKG